MMRYRCGVLRSVLAIGLAAAGAVSFQIDGGAAERRLVIDPEAFVEIPAAMPLSRPVARSLGVPVGPRIELRRPGDASVFRADEPVSVHIEFLPAADGAAPDMETLRVKVRKGWFGTDITDDLEPYVEGDTIQVPEVDFSGHTGEFRFEIRIRDAQGRPGEAQFRVTIRS